MRRLSRPKLCEDCHIDTRFKPKGNGDGYMIHKRLWAVATKLKVKIYLCVSCLENRLNRELKPDDFTDCALNLLFDDIKSELLLKRLGRHDTTKNSTLRNRAFETNLGLGLPADQKQTL